MTDICLMFEVHQPLRLNRNFHQDLLANPVTSKEELLKLYFDNWLNKHIFDRVARKCYLPANTILLAEIERFKDARKQFKVAYGISGVFLEQCKSWNPEVLESFQNLAATGCVEFLEETYYHSLASLWGAGRTEFTEQVGMHRQLMLDLFDYRPTTFGNTECLYNNSIARAVADLGYSAIVTEGVERILRWRSPNFVYRAAGASIPVLLRNYRLSDDIGFRFSSSWWSEWPLTAEKYASWLAAVQGQTIVLFVDYETFGEHHWPEGGIQEFLRWLPGEVFKWEHLYWRTPREVVKLHQPVGEIDVHDFNTVSWADLERDPSAWITNPMQLASFEALKALEPLVKGLGDPHWLRLWRYLQMSDHLYYMSVKGGGPGDVHCYFNPSGNPIDAFVSFSNVVSDFEARILQELQKPELAAKWILRRLPPDKVFNFFHDFARPAGIEAYDLGEFSKALMTAPARSLTYHVERGDFARWLRHVLRDKELATQIDELAEAQLRGEKLRQKLTSIVKARIRQLEALAAKVGTDA